MCTYLHSVILTVLQSGRSILQGLYSSLFTFLVSTLTRCTSLPLRASDTTYLVARKTTTLQIKVHTETDAPWPSLFCGEAQADVSTGDSTVGVLPAIDEEPDMGDRREHQDVSAALPCSVSQMGWPNPDTFEWHPDDDEVEVRAPAPYLITKHDVEVVFHPSWLCVELLGQFPICGALYGACSHSDCMWTIDPE